MELESQTPLPANLRGGEQSEPTPLPVNPQPELNTRTDTLGESAPTEVDPSIAVETALDLYEQRQKATPQNGEASLEPTVEAETTIEWDSDRVRKLSDSFKEVFGVDLKDTHQMMQDLQAQYNTIQEERAEQAVQAQLQSLQESWGVNEAELNRRVNSVVEYAAKLPAELRAQVDNPEGFKLIWSRIEQTQASPTSAKSSGKAQTQPEYKFRKSELSEMMLTRPEEYNARQAEIAQAYARGQVLSDR